MTERLAFLPPAVVRGIRLGVTALMLALAAWAASKLWQRYQADPWTRDGRVRADVVAMAPDVAGLVTEVDVGNDQPVRKGQLLFVVDRARYALALRQAEDGVATARAARAALEAQQAEARREAARNRKLGDLVATEVTQASEAKVAAGDAQIAQARTAIATAEAARDLAALNLARTRVVAPMDGVLSDISLRAGDYVAPGKPVLALVDTASLRIEGYFEETRLPYIRIGQKATIYIMGEKRAIAGHVTSIAAAIEDHDRNGSANLLPNINPSFSWVRLAERVPVRIAIDRYPADIALISGRTATVTLQAPQQGQRP